MRKSAQKFKLDAPWVAAEGWDGPPEPLLWKLPGKQPQGEGLEGSADGAAKYVKINLNGGCFQGF